MCFVLIVVCGCDEVLLDGDDDTDEDVIVSDVILDNCVVDSVVGCVDCTVADWVDDNSLTDAVIDTTDVVNSSVVGIEERRVDMEVVESILPIVSETSGVVECSVVVSIVAER